MFQTSLAFISPPFYIKYSYNYLFPLLAAKCRAVEESLLIALISTPLSIKSSTISLYPLKVASCKTEELQKFAFPKSAPF